MEKEEFYKRLRIAGMLSFIPLILVIGPLGGYFIAHLLEKKLKGGAYVLYIGIGIGLAVSLTEVVKIIRGVRKIERKT